MTEETINYRIEYDIRGVDRSVRETQRLLYFMNATRLAIVDLQQVMSGPTVANVMWTAVQLTRVWTHLYRLIKATNQAQRIGLAQTIGGTSIGGVSGISARRFAMGQTALPWATTQIGMFPAALAFAAANPLLIGAAAVALTVSALGYRQYFIDRKMRVEREKFLQRQRNVAKTQGLEY